MLSRGALLFFCAAIIAGCGGGQVATVSYDSESNQSTYETKWYTVSMSGANYGSSQSTRMRVLAQCEGEGCIPDTAQLVFSADASERLSLSGVNGRISADGTEIRWTSAEANRWFAGRNRNETIQVLGEFATVDIKFAQLEAMASAASLEGTISGKSLNLDADVQSGLQALLRKIKAQSSGTSSNADT